MRRAAWALGVIAVLFGVHHVAIVFTEGLNWDELALFRRVADTVRSGSISGGGRPGLAVLPLIPMVDGCTDAIGVARAARLLWALFTIAYVVGLFELLRRALRSSGRPEALHGAALAVGMLVLVPVFLRWSVQVRTDQIALACGVWGGVALLASRSRLAWSAVAGALFALGYLATQKLVYVGGLVAVLVAGAQWLERDFALRRELLRGALMVAGAAVAMAGFYVIVPLFYEPQAAVSWEQGQDTFAFYRKAVGYRVYQKMLPTLLPHALAGVLLVLATAARRGAPESRRRLTIAWAIVVLGAGIGWFHAGAFPYFWMTIGLFPAAAIAVALPDLLSLLSTPRARLAVHAGLWLALLAPNVPAALALLDDTQEVQREAYAYIDRNFAAEDRGFHPEGGLFCRRDPDPFRVTFSAQIFATFHGPEGAAATRAFIEEFRRRPVKFVLQSFRLHQFPAAFRAFLQAHYVPYGPSVMVPGFRVKAPRAARRDVDVFVAGDYRFELPPDHPAARIEVDGRRMGAGDVVTLAAGTHSIVTVDDVHAGVLVLALEPPPLDLPPLFYPVDSVKEFADRRARGPGARGMLAACGERSCAPPGRSPLRSSPRS